MKPIIKNEGRYRQTKPWACSAWHIYGYGDSPKEAYDAWLIKYRLFAEAWAAWTVVTKGQTPTP